MIAINHLGSRYAPADGWACAGLLAVAISRELGEYLWWFRNATDRTIDWAGDPRKVVKSSDEDLSSPQRAKITRRGSRVCGRSIYRGRLKVGRDDPPLAA